MESSTLVREGEHWAENAPLAHAFRAFDNANPHVYTELVRLARAWRDRRSERAAGIGMLWEVLRWNLSLRAISSEPFKLNNNHRSFYARKLMAHNPDLDGLFDLRARDSKCECSRCA